MTAPTFSPLRVLLVVLLTLVTVFAVGTFASNATPHARDHYTPLTVPSGTP